MAGAAVDALHPHVVHFGAYGDAVVAGPERGVEDGDAGGLL